MLLAGTDHVDHIELKVANIYDAPRIADQIAEALRAGLRDAGLDRHEPALYSALLLEKIAWASASA